MEALEVQGKLDYLGEIRQYVKSATKEAGGLSTRVTRRDNSRGSVVKGDDDVMVID